MNKLRLILLISIISDGASAQIIMPKFGASISTVHGDLSENSSRGVETGISVGVAYLVEFEKVWIQPELTFMQKGFRTQSVEDVSGSIVTQTNHYNYNYLELPVLVKVSFGEAIKFQSYVGPSIGLGLGGNHKYEMVETDIAGNVTFESKSEFDIQFGEAPFSQRFDFGMQMGATMFFKNILAVDFRYGLSLNDHHDNAESKHRVFQLTVGVPIQL